MSCDAIRDQLLLFLYGELSFDQEEQVHQHLATCGSCKEDLARTRRLCSALDDFELEPASELVAGCRRTLRVRMADLTEAQPSGLRAWIGRIGFNLPLAWLYKPAAALGLVAVGYLGAQAVPMLGGGSAKRFEPVASRVRYVDADGGGRVQIVVEETRERTLSGDMQDEPIRRLLLAAARESSDPGVRVETMDLLSGHTESADVRRALLQALRHDPNAGVRLKALEGLRAFSREPETVAALAQVLLNDTNPGVRTQAIDMLTQSREPSIVGVLQEVMTREDNNYVRLKCQKVLHELNASVETF